MSPIKGMIDSVAALADYKKGKPGAGRARSTAQRGYVGGILWLTFQGWTDDFKKSMAAAAEASDLAGKIMAPIKSMVESLVALASLPVLDPVVMQRNIGVLLQYAEQLVNALVEMAKRFATDGLKAASDLADAGGKIFDMGKSGIDFLDALASFATSYITPQKIDVLADMMLYVLQVVAWMAYQIAPGAGCGSGDLQ